MRGRNALLGLAAVCVLGLVTFAPMSAGAAVPREHVKQLVRSGPAHWFGPHGTAGTWGKAPAPGRTRSIFAGNLSNPGNNEIMPGTTSTYVIFWLPSGYHYSDG